MIVCVVELMLEPYISKYNNARIFYSFLGKLGVLLSKVSSGCTAMRVV